MALISFHTESEFNLQSNSDYNLSSGGARKKILGWALVRSMASAVARAYNGSLGAEPPAGVQGAEPPVEGQGGKAPLKLMAF